MAQFNLILSVAAGHEHAVDLACAISGDNDRWHGKTIRFRNREEAEKALRSAGVLRNHGSPEPLNGLDKGMTVAIPVEPAAAIQLQILYRVDPHRKKERTFIQFHDLRGGVLGQTKEEYRDREIQVGDVLTVSTPLGPLKVRVENIQSSEVKPFGSEETRREVHIEVKF